MRSLTALKKEFEAFKKEVEVTHYDWHPFITKSLESLKDYDDCCAQLRAVSCIEDLQFLLRYNLFILLTCCCNKKHLINKWAYDRCLEIQREPNGYIDLWAREHYKSTIVTFGKTIQDVMISHGDRKPVENEEIIKGVYSWTAGNDSNDRSIMLPTIQKHDIDEEEVIGILSCTKTLAASFLWEIKKELEQNEDLQDIFPDIFYKTPEKYSDKWSMQGGINVKRKSIRKEATVEAWGLITGQPTSKHFTKCVYDDIITHDIVKTLYLNKVATDSWENSLSLCSMDGSRRYAGTRKHFNDTYSEIIKRGAAKLRRYTPYIDNDESKGYVLFTKEEAEQRRKSMGEITWASEYLQDPLKDSAIKLDITKIRYHTINNTSGLALYMYCDPASKQKEKRAGQKGSDYTVYLILGIDPGRAIVLLDGLRDRLSPTQKFNAIYDLWERYQTLKNIHYEEIGLCSDIALFKEKAAEKNHVSFGELFIKISPRMAKQDRLIKLEPLLEQGRLFVPHSMPRTRLNGKHYDLVNELVNHEMDLFPFSEHDDIMDPIAHCAISLENKAIGPLIGTGLDKKPIMIHNQKPVFGNF